MKPNHGTIKALLCLCGCTLAAFAGAGDHGRRAPADALYQTECGSCHLAYPARMLSSADWAQSMKGLDRHFGENASLDKQDWQHISAYLARYAGDGRKRMYQTDAATPGEPRLTTTGWFVHKHRKVKAADFRLKRVGSAANCAACHRDAARGEFDDDTAKTPR